MRLPSLALAAVLLLASTPVHAAPRYTWADDAAQYFFGSPCRHDSTIHWVTSGSDNTVNTSQYATVCEVGASMNATASLLVFTGSTNNSLGPAAYNDDFVIDGSGSYVSGSMYFRLRAHVGGSGGDEGCRADVMPWITIGPNIYTGTYRATNKAGYPPIQAFGILAGARLAGDMDTVVAVTKTWPVNTPFSVEISLKTDVLTSVSAASPLANWWEDAGGLGAGSPYGSLVLGNASGLVMNLPAGYTLRSTNWKIANNQRNSTADVNGSPAPAPGLALAGASPNPATGGRMTVSFALPDGVPASLELLDVAGRRVATRDVGALGAGAHTIELAPGRLAPGLYLVRLTRGSEQRVSRVSVID